MASNDNAITRQLLNGQLQNQQWLQSMVEKLADEGRASLRDVADPVGRSVRMIRVGDRPRALPIDEPVAEALRSRGELTVGESREYRVRLEGVFKTNGACRVRLLDLDKIVVGKITDPSVGSAGNVYTRALNDGAELIVVAKPTMKDGNINRLFISDARAA